MDGGYTMNERDELNNLLSGRYAWDHKCTRPKMKTFVKIIKWPDGRQLRINRHDEMPEDITLSTFDAITLIKELAASINWEETPK
jgi:hypothetical protein